MPGRDRDDQALEQPAGAAHQVLVAERHRIEGARVYGGQSGHGRHVALHAARRRRRSVARASALDAAQCSRAGFSRARRPVAQELEMHRAGAAAAPGREARATRPSSRRPACGRFDVDESRRRRRSAPQRRAPARASANRTADRGRRGRSAPAGARAIHCSASARSTRTRRRRAGAARVAARLATSARIALEQDDLGGAARCRLEAERARAGERIEAAPAVERLAEPVEERLADAVGRRPEPRRVGDRQLAALPRAADDRAPRAAARGAAR